MSTPDSPSALTLHVKCTNSNTAFDLSLSPTTSTVASLKKLVRDELGSAAADRYLRLIAGGKLLAPDSSKLDKFALSDGSYVHAVVAAAGVTSSGVQAQAAIRGTVAMMGSQTAPQDEGESSDEDLEGGGRRGFDTLRSRMSRSEVNAVRVYFASAVREYSDAQPADPSEDEEDRRFRMESEWMSRQGPLSEYGANVGLRGPSLTSGFLRTRRAEDDPWDNDRTGGVGSVAVGTQRDLVWGFILGFFVGFFLLFWIWMPSVTHKQKLGILWGIAAQMVINMWTRRALAGVEGGV